MVVGGGITGAGCALDAVSRGLRTALVERDDFAFGTSSRSSKLVHGGVRYLEHREFGLVREALAERQIALRQRTAPRARAPLPHPDPHRRRAHRPPDRAAARRRAVDVRPERRPADQEGAQAGHPRRGARPRPDARRVDRLASGYLYYDAQADDARLTLAIARDRRRPRCRRREPHAGGRHHQERGRAAPPACRSAPTAATSTCGPGSS